MIDATYMRQEIDEIPLVAARFLAASGETLLAGGAALREKNPTMVATIARGSSDHAASFLKYAIELAARVPVASIGPSVMSIYGHELRLANCAAIAISQSGKSPDIVAMTESARNTGALTFAITNTPDSPLAAAADVTVALAAGEEKSVAATKSFVNSVVAGLGLLAEWTGDESLAAGVAGLPRVLDEAVACDWSPLIDALDGHRSLYVIGRGPSMAIASEAALKFKETCGIHAEAYSSAEVLHGPARIVEAGFPVLALSARDAAEDSVAEVSDRLARQGATVFSVSDKSTGAKRLPRATAAHPFAEALALIPSFYGFVEALSRHRGFDPDRPPYLRKVTETV
jgi:glucosamine--fructose-6-phosphate aminotransferase (isomerizing)